MSEWGNVIGIRNVRREDQEEYLGSIKSALVVKLLNEEEEEEDNKRGVFRCFGVNSNH